MKGFFSTIVSSLDYEPTLVQKWVVWDSQIVPNQRQLVEAWQMQINLLKKEAIELQSPTSYLGNKYIKAENSLLKKIILQ